MRAEDFETPQKEHIFQGLGFSFALHAFIVSVFTLKAVFFTKESIDFSQAVRVDIVALPDKVDPAKDLAPPAPPKKEEKMAEPKQPEPKQVEAPTPPPKTKKPEPKADDGIKLAKIKDQQKNALDRLKAMAALDKIKEDVADEKQKEAAKKAQEASTQIKGNVISPGTSLTGLAKLQHDTYLSDLDRHIKQNWAIPEWLSKRDLKAQARVFIDTRGNILDRKITRTSGNPLYDDEVLSTIDKSAPFPAPPDKFQSIVSVDGILIGFPE